MHELRAVTAADKEKRADRSLAIGVDNGGGGRGGAGDSDDL